jgi:hypothetical protein
MKIRNGFVSNSSSSSFIISSSIIFKIPGMPKGLKHSEVMINPQIFGGETQFGRQRENYKDFGSRINFAFLQCKSIKDMVDGEHQKYNEEFWDRIEPFAIEHYNDLDMLNEILKENLKVKEIIWAFTKGEKFPWDRADQNSPEDNKLYGDLFNLGIQNPELICGYIDHGSMWYENREMYLEMFTDKESLFNWVFGADNFIANRSDEYDDANELEVNHQYDFDNGDLFWNHWDNPEKFDKEGNLIE